MITEACRGRKKRGQAGFTLMEVLVSTSIMSLLLLGGISLYITALQAASRNNAQVGAASRAAITTQQMLSQFRECYAVALPTDSSGFTPPMGGTSAANYVTTGGLAAALQLTMPGTAAVTVINSTGASKTSGTDFQTMYTDTAGATVTYYRSDASGNPAPNNGQYVWECGTPPGQAALPAAGRRYATLAETTSIAANIPDALVFSRAPGSTAAIEVSVIAGDYSAIGGQQSSRSNTSQVVGKWILSRNLP